MMMHDDRNRLNLFELYNEAIDLTPLWAAGIVALGNARTRLEKFAEEHAEAFVSSPAKLVVGCLATMVLAGAILLDTLFVRTPIEFLIAGAVSGNLAVALSWVLPVVIAIIEVYLGYRAAEERRDRRDARVQEQANAQLGPLNRQAQGEGLPVWEILAVLAALGAPAALTYTYILTTEQVLLPFLSFVLIVAIIAHAGTVLSADLLVNTAKGIATRARHRSLQGEVAGGQAELDDIRTRVRHIVSRIIRIHGMWPDDAPDRPRLVEFPVQTHDMIRDAWGRDPIDGGPDDGPGSGSADAGDLVEADRPGRSDPEGGRAPIDQDATPEARTEADAAFEQSEILRRALAAQAQRSDGVL